MWLFIIKMDKLWLIKQIWREFSWRQSTLEFSFKQKLNFTVCVENYLYQAMPTDLIWWKFSVMCVIKILMYFIYLTTFSFGSCCSFDHMKLKISPAPPHPTHTSWSERGDTATGTWERRQGFWSWFRKLKWQLFSASVIITWLWAPGHDLLVFHGSTDKWKTILRQDGLMAVIFWGMVPP